MKEGKSQFLKAAAKGATAKDFETALKGRGDQIPSVVSIPARKRDADDDSEALEEDLNRDKKGARHRKK